LTNSTQTHGGYGNSQKSRQKRINDYLNTASFGDDKAKLKNGIPPARFNDDPEG
jgi:hypothetical protein